VEQCRAHLVGKLRVVLLRPVIRRPRLVDETIEPSSTVGLLWRADHVVDVVEDGGDVLGVPLARLMHRTGFLEPTSRDGPHR
jgi:hypothetical protein